MDIRRGAGVSTQKVTVFRRFNHWFIRAVVLVCTKGISLTVRQAEPLLTRACMALTFGTLLSSQGADAHLQDPFGSIGGNPRHTTRSVPHGQTRPAPPSSHLVGATRQSPDASCLGEVRPTPPSCLALRERPRSWLRRANNYNTSKPSAAVQIPWPVSRK
jgi:hypothetical protein